MRGLQKLILLLCFFFMGSPALADDAERLHRAIEISVALASEWPEDLSQAAADLLGEPVEAVSVGVSYPTKVDPWLAEILYQSEPEETGPPVFYLSCFRMGLPTIRSYLSQSDMSFIDKKELSRMDFINKAKLEGEVYNLIETTHWLMVSQ